MNVDEDAKKALADGFAAIAKQYNLPGAFPPKVVDLAEQASRATNADGIPAWYVDRRDATNLPLMTLDPASSTDLDQAFFLEKQGEEIVLSYALADIGAFVAEGSEIEKEAWNRGVTIYGLLEKTPLYPKVLSQGVASLLPDGPRPAVLVVIAMNPQGEVRLQSVERVVCASRAKLAYEKVTFEDLPLLKEFADRFTLDENRRGAIRVEFPQQEVVCDPAAPGGVRLELHARLPSEWANSTMSLAVNIALGTLMKEAGIGLFRVMEDPTQSAVDKLRRTAHAIGIEWKESESLRDLQRRMNPESAIGQRFLLEARRAGGRARYDTIKPSETPWHSAVAATYVHATAPMRRLADRYVLDLAVMLANHQPVPEKLKEKLQRLPSTMELGEGRAANVDRAVIDLLEAVSLQNRIGEILDAEVVDADHGIVQTHDFAIRAKATKLGKAQNGDRVQVRIEAADPATRSVMLSVSS